MLCDFCGAPGTYVYPCEDFEVVPGIGSKGPWLACDVCHANIEAGDRESISRRAFASFMTKRPAAVAFAPEVAANMERFHVLFFEHRTGEGVPWG